jgi:hypothetical protein
MDVLERTSFQFQITTLTATTRETHSARKSHSLLKSRASNFIKLKEPRTKRGSFWWL